jgi:3-deoxy-D-manno-octulosonate 8-phosphate phosphatase (KDO 8-P phosphatase)
MAPADNSLNTRIRAVRLLVFDFDGVFTDNMVYVFDDGRESVRCTRADGLGLAKLRRRGLEMCIVSTEVNPVVGARATKLKLRCIQGCEDKAEALDKLQRETGIDPDAIAYVGNDINDLPCLTRVGLPIVVQDAHPDVLAHALYRTKIPGGYGAVREICDLFDQVLG